MRCSDGGGWATSCSTGVVAELTGLTISAAARARSTLSSNSAAAVRNCGGAAGESARDAAPEPTRAHGDAGVEAPLAGADEGNHFPDLAKVHEPSSGGA